ncbi:hypothetical protein C7534_117129 [Pseudomonas sp. OV226]|jgi:hypothetical protein|nr:hypothetical protein C7534_117129 [Pseudomonas sp. OV226]
MAVDSAGRYKKADKTCGLTKVRRHVYFILSPFQEEWMYQIK